MHVYFMSYLERGRRGFSVLPLPIGEKCEEKEALIFVYVVSFILLQGQLNIVGQYKSLKNTV